MPIKNLKICYTVILVMFALALALRGEDVPLSILAIGFMGMAMYLDIQLLWHINLVFKLKRETQELEDNIEKLTGDKDE